MDHTSNTALFVIKSRELLCGTSTELKSQTSRSSVGLEKERSSPILFSLIRNYSIEKPDKKCHIPSRTKVTVTNTCESCVVLNGSIRLLKKP